MNPKSTSHHNRKADEQPLSSNFSNRLLNEIEAADYLGFTRRTLQNWRHYGGGPLYVKIGARAVRYRIIDLDAWAASQLCGSTSEFKAKQTANL